MVVEFFGVFVASVMTPGIWRVLGDQGSREGSGRGYGV